MYLCILNFESAKAFKLPHFFEQLYVCVKGIHCCMASTLRLCVYRLFIVDITFVHS